MDVICQMNMEHQVLPCCSGTQRATSAETPEWLKAEALPAKRRDRMPKPKQVEKQHSLWSIIKECIGKDLSRVCLPVYFNEPISALQKTAEDLEYSELLDKVSTILLGISSHSRSCRFVVQLAA